MSSDVMTIEPLPGAAPVDERAEVPAVAPVARHERISSVDVLRGVALLGILVMNIPDFGMPGVGFAPPSVVAGADRGANFVAWLVAEFLFEGKMRAIFSMLFGAGAIILTSRAEERGVAAGAADVYYRRALWLVGFGLLHAYFVWWGDILYAYGVFGLALYPLRKASPKALIVVALAIIAGGSAFTHRRALQLEEVRTKAAAAELEIASGEPLDDARREARQAWSDARARVAPDAEQIAKDVAAHRTGYREAFAARSALVAQDESSGLYRRGVFDIAAFMLVGMALMKAGVLSAARTRRFYVGMVALGYTAGFSLNAYETYRILSSGFEPVATMHAWTIYDLTRLLVALGHIGLVMIVVKSGALGWLTSRLAAVGQMALTNYLTHSVVFTLLFNGYGFDLYGRFEFYQLLYLVAAMWAVQLVVSPLWVRRFRFGPAEWVWRSLTYWRRQPMRAL